MSASSLLLTLLALAGTTPAEADRARIQAKAEGKVSQTLADRGLRVGGTTCRRSGGWSCRWRAADEIAGWTYRCDGAASLPAGLGAVDVERCHRRAPVLAPLDAEPTTPAFGFNEGWRERPDLLDEGQAAGADTNRFVVSWMSVQPRRDVSRWDLYDPIYDSMLEAGARPVLVLISAPCWAQAAPPGPCREEREAARPPARRHVADFARFAAAAAKRYPEALAIEIWNEPNSGAFWRARRPDPALYAEMLAAARRAVGRDRSDLPVVSGGLAPFGSTRDDHFAAHEFLDRVYRATPGSSGAIADAIAVHPYPGDGRTPTRRVRTLLAQAKAVQIRHGDAHTPLWVTEVGLSTSSAERVSELGQARGLVAIYEILRRVPGVPVVLFHRLTDLREGPSSPESGWGVLEAGGAAKPAYCSLAGAVAAASGADLSAPEGC